MRVCQTIPVAFKAAMTSGGNTWAAGRSRRISGAVSDIFPGTRRVVIKNLPYVAFIRPVAADSWQVIDMVHTSRRLRKGESSATPDS